MTATAERTVSSPSRSPARDTLRRSALRDVDEADLVAELNARMDARARCEADLEDGIFADGDADQLRGGIEFEEFRIEEIVHELERRERARAFGYRGRRSPDEPDLPERFARFRGAGPDELVGIIEQETTQVGRQSAGRWYFSCPFHAAGQERTPSLVVFPDGRGHCFSCGWHGDAIDFVAETRGTSLVSALLLLERGMV